MAALGTDTGYYEAVELFTMFPRRIDLRFSLVGTLGGRPCFMKLIN